MLELVILIVFFAISFAIAYYLGNKRQIGFGFSFFFCLTLTPIIGFIITMLSRKYYEKKPDVSNTKKVLGWILVVLSSLSLIPSLADGFGVFLMTLGLIGVGFYLIELGKGNNLNKKALTNYNE